MLSRINGKKTSLGVIERVQIITMKHLRCLKGPSRAAKGFRTVLRRINTRKATCNMLEFSRISAGTNANSKRHSENKVTFLLPENE